MNERHQNVIVTLRQWWRKRQYQKWELMRLEAIGKQAEVLRGVDGIIYRIAMLDQVRAENMMRHYGDKQP